MKVASHRKGRRRQDHPRPPFSQDCTRMKAARYWRQTSILMQIWDWRWDLQRKRSTPSSPSPRCRKLVEERTGANASQQILQAQPRGQRYSRRLCQGHQRREAAGHGHGGNRRQRLCLPGACDAQGHPLQPDLPQGRRGDHGHGGRAGASGPWHRQHDGPVHRGDRARRPQSSRPTKRSNSWQRIIGVTKVRVVANKVRDAAGRGLYARASIPADDLLGFIHYNAEVIDADRQGMSPYDFSPTSRGRDPGDQGAGWIIDKDTRSMKGMETIRWDLFERVFAWLRRDVLQGGRPR